MEPTNDEQLLDKAETAARLSITPRHLQYLIEKRRIPFVKVGGRTIRFRPSDLRDWIDENYVETV